MLDNEENEDLSSNNLFLYKLNKNYIKNGRFK